MNDSNHVSRPRLSGSEHRALIEQIESILLDEASDEQFRAFEQQLRTSDAARSFAVRYLHLHGLLKRFEAASQPEVVAALAWLGDDSLLVPAPSNAIIPVGIRSRLAQTAKLPVVWTITAAGLLFAAYFVLISWGMLDRGRDAEVVATGNAPVENQELETKNQQSKTAPVANVTATEDAKWLQDVGKSLRDLQLASRRDAATEIAAGEPLNIASGIVELQLKQGVTLLIEGPAKWSIDGNNHATLNRGKLVANVPPQAIGFTLTTPTAKIVDLGTEFGVEVASDGKSELHVRQGIVDVRATAATSSTGAVRLSAGQAARISAGDQRVLPIPADTVRFDLRAPAALPNSTLGPIELANPSFELPAVVPPLETKHPEGWFVTAAEATADIGLQVGNDGQFLYWNEPAGSLGQFIRGHRVPAAGVTYRLKARVAAANHGRCAMTTRLLVNELTDERRTLKQQLTAGPWRTLELTYTTTAEDVGKRVGIVFEFATLAPGVQVSLDDVTLETHNPTPTENPEAIK